MQIKETMQRYGYTTATLAKKMGVFDSTVSRLMNGNPTIQKLRDLAAAIGCPLWEFFADEMPESEEFFAEQSGKAERRVKSERQRVGDGTSGMKFLAVQATRGRAATATEATAQLEQPTHQPSNISHQPSASLQQAIICPHCHQALVMNIASYEQK